LAPMLTETEMIDLVTITMPAMIFFIGGTSFDEPENKVESSQKPNDDIPINNRVPTATSAGNCEPNPTGLSSSLS